MRNVLIFVAAVLLCVAANAQTLPVGTPILEEAMRRYQLTAGQDTNVSFTIRPVFSGVPSIVDSIALRAGFPQQMQQQRPELSVKKAVVAKLLPLTVNFLDNTHHPYGWNDGSLIPAKGGQTQISLGVYAKFGILSIQLRPEFVYAQNAPFATFLSLNQDDSLLKRYVDNVADVIDAPERFGEHSYSRLFAGQSSIRVNYKKFSVGVSTENLWWGPGIRNSLLMSNNAPGFPHLTFNSVAPLKSPVGTFEGQLIGGLLKKSGFLLPDTNRQYNGQPLYITKPQGNRYINGMVVCWQPKWTKGLFLGMSRVFYAYQSNVEHSFDGFLPVIGQFFRKKESSPSGQEASKRDQMVSFFFRLLLPKEKAEVYAEFGRNDFAGDSRDFWLEPEHSRAYVIGFRKLFEQGQHTQLELLAELTTLQVPSTILLREQSGWYSHYQVRDGYTNQGQVIGAGIGTGGSSQSIGLNWVNGIKKTGFLFERIVHNNDFYYAAFAPTRDYMRHWVDLAFNLTKSWQHKNFLYDARLSWIKSLNYEWQEEKDVHNLSAALSISYLF